MKATFEREPKDRRILKHLLRLCEDIRNGTKREREKVMRGMDSAESAQQLIDAIRINYNFCREHSRLGKTPAELAGINLGLNENRIENLIRKARANANGK